MIRAWRIVRSQRIASAFDGEGARLYPGRWNDRGSPVVYAASSLALAALEILVHLEDQELLAREFVGIPVDFPDGACHRTDPQSLPDGWDAEPPGEASRRVGRAWLEANSRPALSVPSVVITLETNYLLNPRHPDFAKRITVGQPHPFHFDPRLHPA
ncbi:RES family NAD+ phosphorylase [soil metagenome]